MTLDHIYGTPSTRFSRYSTLAVIFVWTTYLIGGDRHGPPVVSKFSQVLSKRLSAWQLTVFTLLTVYITRRFDVIFNLGVPSPLAGMYKRTFFRATWIVTAMDAGFWSAMDIKGSVLRNMISLLLSGYYLVFAEEAEDKVRRTRQQLTVEHMRNSWNKTLTQPLNFILSMLRPRFMKYPPRQIRIPRPASSAYTEPITAWLYYDGPLSALKNHDKIVLDFHGGGFVAMTPRSHDDALMPWAGKTGLPIVAVDYKKAPEYPYPYALHECYDAYVSIIASRGRAIGLSGNDVPEVVLCGDSAGGTLATGVMCMILETGTIDNRHLHGGNELPVPTGLVLIYPALDCNIGNWMTDEQMALIRDPRSENTNKTVIAREDSEYRTLNPKRMTVAEGADTGEGQQPEYGADGVRRGLSLNGRLRRHNEAAVQPISPHGPVRTRLATPSLISYTYDRILTPEMMRAMIILYIGPHARPDFGTDYYLSPVLAPESLLARFPKTYFLTGERDPLVDDTVIMAGRIRAAKLDAWESQAERGLLSRAALRRGFDVREHVEVKLLDGVSHGFIHFVGIWPEGWRHILRVGRWFEECFAWAEYKQARDARDAHRRLRVRTSDVGPATPGAKSATDTASSADEDAPLEMTMVSSTAGGRGKSAPSTARRGRPRLPRIDTGKAESDEDEEEYAGLPAMPATPGKSRFAREHPAVGGRPKHDSKSSTSLASEDDILGRRMTGLAGKLGQPGR